MIYNFNPTHEVIAGILTAPLTVRLALAGQCSSDAALRRILMLDTSPEVRQAALNAAAGKRELQA